MLFNSAVLVLLWSAVAKSAEVQQTAAALLRRQAGENAPQCTAFYSVESSCSSKVPDFTDLSFTQQASCLCYQGTSYAPSIYDGYFATCVDYLATASSSFYSELGGTDLPTAPCALAASVTATASSTQTGSQSGTITAAPSGSSVDLNAAACTSWDQIEQECSLQTPGFGTLSFKSEASCLCYQGTSYAPQIYDGYWQSCLSFFETANATFYSSISSRGLVSTPCAAAGNVKNNATTTSMPTTTRSTGSVTVLTTQASTSSTPTSTSTSSNAASKHFFSQWIVGLSICIGVALI